MSSFLLPFIYTGCGRGDKGANFIIFIDTRKIRVLRIYHEKRVKPSLALLLGGNSSISSEWDIVDHHIRIEALSESSLHGLATNLGHVVHFARVAKAGSVNVIAVIVLIAPSGPTSRRDPRDLSCIRTSRSFR